MSGIFSEKKLAKMVEAIVPPDRTNAIVGTVDANGIAVVVKMAKGAHWTVEATYRRDWGGHQTGQAEVIYSW